MVFSSNQKFSALLQSPSETSLRDSIMFSVYDNTPEWITCPSCGCEAYWNGSIYFCDQYDWSGDIEDVKIAILRHEENSMRQDRQTSSKRSICSFRFELEIKHISGADKATREKFGAVWGCGDYQGQSYAIPTMHGGPETIAPYLDTRRPILSSCSS